MNTTFPLSGKTSCLHFTKSTSQRETLPGKRKTFPRMNKTKLFVTIYILWKEEKSSSALVGWTYAGGPILYNVVELFSTVLHLGTGKVFDFH